MSETGADGADPFANAGLAGAAAAAPKPASARDRIIEAVMELAAEREWDDFGVSDVARRAGVSLADFRACSTVSDQRDAKRPNAQ